MKRNEFWEKLYAYWQFDKWYIISMIFVISSVAMIGNYMEWRGEVMNNRIDNYLQWKTEKIESEVHIHANLKMFINGRKVELYIPENFEKDGCSHFHEGSENVIHVHCPGVTIGDFLNSIDAMKYVDGINVVVMVNEHSAYFDTIINDLDKILITDAEHYKTILSQYYSIGNLASENQNDKEKRK